MARSAALAVRVSSLTPCRARLELAWPARRLRYRRQLSSEKFLLR